MAEQKKILIIEDEEHLLRALNIHLTHQGFLVITARDGEEGLKLINSHKPDLLILDITLPKLSGIAVYKAICDKQGKPKVPVLVLTARSELENFFEDINVDAFIPKPFEFVDLLKRVRLILLSKEQPLMIIIDKKDSTQAKEAKKGFHKTGMRVEIVEDLEDISKIVNEQRPKAIFMNYVQDKNSLEDAIKKVKNVFSAIMEEKLKPMPKVPMIVYSSSGFDYKPQSLSAGADIFVEHSYEHEPIITMIEFLIEKEEKETGKKKKNHYIYLIDIIGDPFAKKLKEEMRKKGFEVRPLENLRQLRMAMADRRPDLVVMEYMQTSMSGEEFIEKAKEMLHARQKFDENAEARPPIFIYSYTDMDETNIKAIKAKGADVYAGALKNENEFAESYKNYLREKTDEEQHRRILRGK